jgi:hypothetical protein
MSYAIAQSFASTPDQATTFYLLHLQAMLLDFHPKYLMSTLYLQLNLHNKHL